MNSYTYNVTNVIYDKEKLQLYIESHFFRNIIHSSMVYIYESDLLSKLQS